MPSRFVGILPILFLFVVSLSACKREPDAPIVPTAQTPGCRLTGTNDQLVESSGQLTDQLQRSFIYTDRVLTDLVELSPNRQTRFELKRTNGRLMQAINGQETIDLTYPATATLPASATFTRSGVVQSTVALTYDASGRLQRVTEHREVLPTNSLTTDRTYTFTYDNTGNLTTEQAEFILVDGVKTRQETEYTFTDKPSPYTRFVERPLLTIISLSLGVETLPGRFWHQNACTGYKTYALSSSGTRDNLRESVTYTPTFDATTKLTTQDQTALLYQTSNPTPVTRTNRQTFRYACE